MEYSMGVPMPQDEHTGLRDGILRECGLHPPVVALASPDAAMRLLACARVASLDDREVYFGPPAVGWAAWAMTPPVKGERERVALSPRNETAACALVLELLTEAGEAAAAVLPVARALCDTALAPPLGDDSGAAGAAPPDDAGVGDAMIAWTRAGGAAASTSGAGAVDGDVRVSIVPARFPSTGRGAAAAADLPAGADAVRVPSRTLWTVQHAFDEPGARGEAYRTFAALGEDTVAALWLVYERAVKGASSKWAPLLNSLPPLGAKLTPASWPPDAIAFLLGGTPLAADAAAAREKLARQYAALFPALSEHYPEAFPAEAYTADAFRGAAEAWNAYGMTVMSTLKETTSTEKESLPVNTPVTCLPTVALLCNHSVWPHAVRYSRLRGDALHVPVARSVRKNEEVFVSYGAKSNAELLLFYGFCVENNPYDDVPLSLELPQGEVAEVTRARSACLQRWRLALSPHAARAAKGVAPGLMGTLRVLTADAAALATCVQDPRVAPVSSEGEPAAAAALCGALAALLEQLDEGDAALASPEGAAAAASAGPAAVREAAKYRAGVRRTLEVAAGEARAWRAAVGGGPDPSLGKRTRD
jgi:histone-lysine N-methyltransferase SETD3